MGEQKTIHDLMKMIEVDSSFRIKTPTELLSEEDYILVKEAFDVITKYRNRDWMHEISEAELQVDIIYLQGTIVLLAEKLALAGTYQDSEEDKVKVVRAKIRLALKELKNQAEIDTPGNRITVEDIKDASVALTENISDKYEDVKIANNFIKYVFYAVKDHVQYLDKALHRMYAFIPERMKAQEVGHDVRTRKSSVSVSGSAGLTE